MERAIGAWVRLTVNLTTVNSGSDALAIQNASGQYADVSAALIGGGETLTYTRFYFRIASPASATTTLAEGLDQNGAVLWLVVYDAGRHGIDAYFWNGGRARATTFIVKVNVVAPDTWYGLEVEDNEQSTGHAEIWLDGTSLDAINGDLSDSLGMRSSRSSPRYRAPSTSMMSRSATPTMAQSAAGIRCRARPQYHGPRLRQPEYGYLERGADHHAHQHGYPPARRLDATIGGTNAGDFAKGTDTCTGATVGVGAHCAVTLTFTPGAAGSRGATLTFSDNAPGGGTQTVSLSGTGVVPPPPPPPAASTSRMRFEWQLQPVERAHGHWSGDRAIRRRQQRHVCRGADEWYRAV